MLQKKVEKAVYFSRITDIPGREAVYWKRFCRVISGANKAKAEDPDTEAFLKLPGNSKFPDRIYFGNEFCEKRIPSPKEFNKSVELISPISEDLTFLTPPVSDVGLKRLTSLFETLSERKRRTEIVFNDWGVLRRLSNFSNLIPVLGRLLLKFLRDPRITPRFIHPDTSEDTLKIYQQCSINIAGYRTFLEKYGVKRMELDNLYQGISIHENGMDWQSSLYIPFGYVASGRICLIGNQHIPKLKKFRSNERCKKECLQVELSLYDKNAKNNGGKYAFNQRGNTIFYQQDGPLVSRGIAWAYQHGARLVYMPEIPF